MINIKAVNTAKNVLTSIVSDEYDRCREGKLLFIVPETSKASVERILFDKVLSLNPSSNVVNDTVITSGLIEQDVISFIKLSERVVSSCGGDLEAKSNDLLLRNVIYKIFVLHADEFRTISKYVKRFEYIDMIINLLGDFTRYGVDVDCLDEVLNSVQAEDNFYDKIYDLKLLMKYISEANIEYGYSLLDSYLKRAVEIIHKVIANKSLLEKRLYSGVKALAETNIVIYGFGTIRTFTPQENEFIEALSELGANITIYPLYDLVDSSSELYYFGDLLIKSLSRNGKISSITQYEPGIEYSNSAMNTIAQAYAMGDSISVDKNDGSVELIKMLDSDDMLSYVCNEIIRLTREEGYRYRDIRVFCPDDDITNRLKGIMRLFKLDAFIDRKIVLDDTPVMRYVEILLELALHRYPIEDVLRLFRTGMVPVTSELTDYFENFCKAKNISYEDRIFDETRYSCDFNNGDKPFKMYINGKVIDNGGAYLAKSVLNRVLIPIRDVIDDIVKADTIAKKSVILMTHLDSLRHSVEALRNEYIDRGDTATASAIVRGYKELMSLLSSFASPVNDVEISLEQFCSLIKIDIRNKVIGTIPLTVDSIEIVNEASACYSPCKVLFMVGCNSSNFPHRSVSEGIMSNQELLQLNSGMANIELPDKVLTQSKAEFVRSAIILNLVSDKTYMFVLESELENSAMTFYRDALGFDSIPGKIFKTPIYGLPEERRHDYLSSFISPDIIKELLGLNASMSVSSLEKYNTCALKYMLDNVLKIRTREDETKVHLNVVGSIVHSMFEDSIKDIVSENNSIEQLSSYIDALDENKLTALADKHFNIARLQVSSPDRNTALYEIMPGIKVKRIFMRAIPVLLKYCVENEYLPTRFEEKIEDFEVPYKVLTENGIEFAFKGFIDRIDVGNDGKLRIVDYKTGNKSINIKEFIAGIQIQLFSYALALKIQDENSVIDNVGYIEVLMSPHSLSKPTNPFEYEKTKFNSENINYPIDYAGHIIRQSCENISKGIADGRVNSRSKDSCGYCPFRGVCGNNPNSQGVRVVNTELPEEEIDKKLHKKGNSYTMQYFIDVMKRNVEND